MRFRTSLPLSFLSIFTFACASVPSFQPSRPIDETGSLEEALVLCGEYEVPDPAERPVTLKPFLRCLDAAAEAHPAAAARSPFRVFRDEFELRYGLLTEHEWTPRLGVEIGGAAHAVMRALWRNGKPVTGATPAERDWTLKHFPRAAEAIGARRWRTSTDVSLDPGLEALKAGLKSLTGGSREGEAQSSAAFDPSHSEALCRRLSSLRREVDYLSALWIDARDIAKIEPGGGAADAVKARYQERSKRAGAELEGLRGAVAQARSRGAFRASSCGGG